MPDRRPISPTLALKQFVVIYVLCASPRHNNDNLHWYWTLLGNRGHQLYIAPVPVFRTRPLHALVVAMSTSHPIAMRIRPGTSGYSVANHKCRT